MVQVDATGGAGVMRKLRRLVLGQGLKARTARSSFWAMISMAGQNVLKLVSSLILTRLLFPEAFGLMAIVQVFVTGLQMFSDTGVRTAIIQNERGDEPDFLNTAWTIQVGRGMLLWLATCALALPVAYIYDEPLLAQLLPVVGISVIIRSFQPTKVFTANRHMMIGRVTVLGLVAQVLGLAASATLAWFLQSVWALVFGGLLGTVIRQLLMRYVLPGMRNRFHWDREIARELFHFGKYIFASTMFGFIVNHADRAIMGGFIPLSTLGIYTIAMTLAALPFSVAQTLTDRIILPLYRMRPVAASESNRRHIFAVRRLLIAGGLLGNLVLAYAGVFLIDLLYDDRYILAGPMITLICLVYVPRIVFVGAGAMLLSQGDSRRFMYYVGTLAAVQTVFLVVGTSLFGIVGAIVSHALAILVTSPLRIHYARRYEAWDWKGETGLLVLGLALGSFACWLQLDRIVALL